MKTPSVPLTKLHPLDTTVPLLSYPGLWNTGLSKIWILWLNELTIPCVGIVKNIIFVFKAHSNLVNCLEFD